MLTNRRLLENNEHGIFCAESTNNAPLEVGAPVFPAHLSTGFAQVTLKIRLSLARF
jgi:hypothetical protein